MNVLPKNPIMLLSVVNTALRDNYSTLEEFCEEKEADKEYIINKLEKINYFYDESTNQFI